jgi:hypothetical protein
MANLEEKVRGEFFEGRFWLCPIEDRRRIDSSCKGIIEGFSLGSYPLLVDYSGPVFREGKATISWEVAGSKGKRTSN